MGELPHDKLLKEDELQRLSPGPDETQDENVDRLKIEREIESDYVASPPFRQPGDIVGRHFEVISVLGGGGQSVVYKARHQVLNKVRAVKVMLPDRILNDRVVRRFHQEAKAVSKLEHPGIVKVHEFDVDESDQPYIVMDYVEGSPLSSVIQELGCLTESKTIALLSQAVEALSLAHAKGVVHRDLKPSNLMVATEADGRQTIRLVDFGIAKVTMPNEKNTTLTSTGEAMGSPLYMSPEQCLSKPIDFRTDIYSLGCVMHECLTGKPPFQSSSFLGIIMSHVQEPLQITDNRVSSALNSIMQRCMAKDPTERYDSMEELKADLQKAAQGLPIEHAAAKRAHQHDYSKIQKTAPLLLISLLCLIAILWASPLIKATIGAPSAMISGTSSSSDDGEYGGISTDSFHHGMVPAHKVDLITFWPTGYEKADRFDNDSMENFKHGQFQKAIEDLKFCISTYKENGTHYGDPDIETAYLGEAYYHLSQCYSATGQTSEAAASLHEAVRLLGKIKLNDKWASAAISEYANVLRASGKGAEAGQMMSEYQSTGRVNHVP